MSKFVTSDQLQQYLQTSTRFDRLTMLKQWRRSQVGFPLAVTRDLFGARLSSIELSAVLELSMPESKVEFEFWVFENLLHWPQDLAATALRTWAAVTDCVLWHRLAPVLRLPGLPQRLHYCILDVSAQFAGADITSIALATSGWEDYSPAYHALLFDHAIQFSLVSKRLDSLATKIISAAQTIMHPEDKSLQSAVTWLLRAGESKKLLSLIDGKPEAAWKHFVHAAIVRHEERKKDFDRVQKALAKAPVTFSRVLEEWPAPWSRQGANSEILESVLKLTLNDVAVDCSQILNGCSGTEIEKAVRNLDLEFMGKVLPRVRNYLSFTTAASLVEKLTVHSIGINQENDWLATSGIPSLRNERVTIMAAQGSIASIAVKSSSDLQPIIHSTSTEFGGFAGAVREFFSCMRGKADAPSASSDQDFWSQLTRAWAQPKNCDLATLTTASRKQKGIATICYLNTLGRFSGNDEAVLKILDHIRTAEEDELRAIVTSLGDINTTRSLQELIAIITRPNATSAIQQDVVAILVKRDVSALQKELRATVQDLQMPIDSTSVWGEIKEALSSLIQTQSTSTHMAAVTGRTSPNMAGIDDKQLDEELGRMIPNYRDLSSEVRRALRTALFFNHSITGSEATHAIDLSPLIDMQYKAMELLFREFFEDTVSQSLQRGDIPRKLDVIGYARPIPQKMDEFEGFVSSLPIVREIPFFSKFKLRKTLRAICQFEPGRRFTLDGLKAFGLFFLCFSRKECRFGLANLFPIGLKDDRELAEFAKELHVFQDFRNRAAHEGFHPEASNDIQGIWRTTAFIVQGAFKIRDSIIAASAARPLAKVS